MRCIALAFALMLASCQPVMAQQTPCGNPADLAERLATEYREAVSARGIDAAGRLVLFFANPATGTWTVMIQTPAGAGCIVATGEAWEAVEQTPPPAPGKSS